MIDKEFQSMDWYEECYNKFLDKYPMDDIDMGEFDQMVAIELGLTDLE